jgi:hypothetical protein
MTRTRITLDGLADQSVTTAKIADASITTAKIAAGAVVEADLASASVTYAKMQNVAGDRLLGRSSGTAGVCEEIVCTSAGRALLDDASAADQRTTLGLGSINDVSGNVGIGTASPSWRLHLYHYTADCVAIVQGRGVPFGGTGKAAMQLDVDGHGGFALQVDATSGTRLFRLRSNGGYGAGDFDCLVVSPTGRVGVGNSSPQNVLHVDSSASFSPLTVGGSDAVGGIEFRNTGATLGYIHYDTTPSMIFHVAASEKMRILTNGNVGIGTSAPATNLHIVEATRPDIRLSGAGPTLDVFTTTAAAYVGTTTSHTIAVRTNNVDRWAIDANGNFSSTTQGGTTLLPQFQCRAWVAFNGTADSDGIASSATTPRFIRASGNVTSVTRNATGDYSIAFNNAMPDAEYCCVGTCGTGAVGHTIAVLRHGLSSTTAVRVTTIFGNSTTTTGVALEATYGHVAIFR